MCATGPCRRHSQPFCQSCRLNDMIPFDLRRETGLDHAGNGEAQLIYTLIDLVFPRSPRRTAPTDSRSRSRRARQTRRCSPATAMASSRSTSPRPTTRSARRCAQQMGESLPHAARPLPPRDRPLLLGPAGRAAAARAVSRAVRRRTRDYDEALEAPLHDGPPKDWPDEFVSAYASMHPWEDWAETWAHYLHMVDTLETARGYGLALRPKPRRAAPSPKVDHPRGSTSTTSTN